MKNKIFAVVGTIVIIALSALLVAQTPAIRELKVNSSNVCSQEVHFTGDFSVDSPTLYVNKTSNRIGIGKSNPATALDVNGTATVVDDLYAKNTTAMRGGGIIRNGDMPVCQRQPIKGNGINLTMVTYGYSNASYTLDGWVNQLDGGVYSDTIRQYSTQTLVDTPRDGYAYASNYLEVTNAVAVASPSGSNAFCPYQPIKSSEIYSYAGSAVSVSFWAWADSAANYDYAIMNADSDRSYVKSFTLAANTWTKITDTLTLDTSGWGIGSDAIGGFFFVALSAGSDLQGVAGWQAGKKICTSGHSNFADAALRKFRFTNVKIEPGSQVTPFIAQSYQDELARNIYYYERKSTVTQYSPFGVGVGAAGNIMNIILNYSPKRSIPTVVLGPTTASFIPVDSAVRTLSSLTPVGAYMGKTIGTIGLSVDSTTAGAACLIEDANGTAYIEIKSEL